MATQSVTGKAFEYALITEANNILSARQVSTLLVADAAYTNAKSAFDLFAAKSQRISFYSSLVLPLV